MDFLPLIQLMDHLASELNPGCTVRVYLGKEQVFTYSAGFADLENRVPFAGGELFHMYSNSKVATVTAGVQLLERGAMKLSDPLYAYIPEFKEICVLEDGKPVKAKQDITIEQLFTMTAGFCYDLDSPGFQKARTLTGGKMDTVEAIRRVAFDPLSFQPGTRWQYSICHDVLAAVISVVSGMKFRDYMRQNIFAPLGMEDTTYHPTALTHARMAEQYRFVHCGSPEYPGALETACGLTKDGCFINAGKSNAYILGEEYDSGGAGIITSAEDYAKFLAALANRGLGLTGERILTPESLELLRSNRLSGQQLLDYNWEHLKGCGYGLGVRVMMDPEKSGLRCNVGEFGWGGAAGSTCIIDPDIGLAVLFVQHCLNPREEYYQPLVRDTVYRCIK